MTDDVVWRLLHGKSAPGRFGRVRLTDSHSMSVNKIMKSYFFETTRSAHLRISELFDFVWPAAAAMWNLRSQIVDHLKSNPDVNDRELDEKFAHPANVYGASLKSAWISKSWESQQEELARILLINVVATYEGWVRNTFNDLRVPDANLAKEFGFSDETNLGLRGVEFGLSVVTAQESESLKACFYNQLQCHKMYAPKQLNAMMTCYRYFKELRNCEIHNSGLATRWLVEAFDSLTQIKTAEELALKVLPRFHKPALGKRTQIELFGVTGLASLMLRTIVTLDVELSRSSAAENAFLKKWRGVHPQVVKLPTDEHQLKTTLRRLFLQADFPISNDVEKMRNLLWHLGLVHKYETHGKYRGSNRIRASSRGGNSTRWRNSPIDKY